MSEAQAVLVAVLQDQLAEARAEIEWLRAALSELENSLTWHTTCLNCASLLDRSYDDYVRAEKAEARLAAIREFAEKCGYITHDQVEGVLGARAALRDTGPTEEGAST